MLIGDPDWHPWRWGSMRSGYLLGPDGTYTDDPAGIPEERTQWWLPPAYASLPRFWIDPHTRQLTTLPPAAPLMPPHYPWA